MEFAAPLPLVKVAMPPGKDQKPLEDVLYGGMIAEGDKVYHLESEFSQAFQLPIGLSVSSGTGTAYCFIASGVMPGDEVITTSMTAEPTNTVILQWEQNLFLLMLIRRQET